MNLSIQFENALWIVLKLKSSISDCISLSTSSRAFRMPSCNRLLSRMNVVWETQSSYKKTMSILDIGALAALAASVSILENDYLAAFFSGSSTGNL